MSNDNLAQTLRRQGQNSNDGYLATTAMNAAFRIEDDAARINALEAQNARLRDDNETVLALRVANRRLSAENARLREALEPFAKVADFYDGSSYGPATDDDEPFGVYGECDLKVLDFRRVRAALEGK